MEESDDMGPKQMIFAINSYLLCQCNYLSIESSILQAHVEECGYEVKKSTMCYTQVTVSAVSEFF